MSERLHIQKREVIGFGIANLPSSKWQECDSDVIFELTDEEVVRKKILGENYVESMSVSDTGELEVVYRVRFNPEDTDFPPIHFFDTQVLILKDPEKIDRLFRPGCGVGRKTIFRRKS